MIVSEIQISYKPFIPVNERQIITDSDLAYRIIQPAFSGLNHYEEFFLISLARDNSVLGKHLLSKGGTSGTVVDLKIALQVLINSNASAAIFAHNHPSGQLKPSQADINITKKSKEAFQLLDISLLDHLIVSAKGYYSFADEGLI